MATSGQITVTAPPSTPEVSQQLLASMAAQSGVATDYNKGSQIRTLSEALGSVEEISGISAVAVALQVIAYSGMSLFDIVPNGAVPASGVITFATALLNPPPAVTNVAIPSGTLMQTVGGVQFATTTGVTLLVGATGIAIPILAVNGGYNTNVPASAITQLLSNVVFPLTIYNLQPTGGGVDAETPSQVLQRLAAKFLSLIGGSPTSVANSAIGVVASGTGETVVYSTCYEGWADINSPNYPNTPGFVCYDADTELLTETGWMKLSDINEETAIRAATLNPDTHEIEYQHITKYHKYKYKGDMIHFESSGYDVRVTPDHQMYTATDKSDLWKLSPAHSIGKWRKIKLDGVWQGNDQLKTVMISGWSNHKEVYYEISIETWLEFLGYYLSEGSTASFRMPDIRDGSSTRSRRVTISQHNKDTKKIIKVCLDKLPFKFHEDKAGFVANSKEIYEEVIHFGFSFEKYVPSFIKTLSSRLINIFLDALMLGDGSKRYTDGIYDGEYKLYTTSSKVLADDVQELLLKTGRAGLVRKCDNPKGGVIFDKLRNTYQIVTPRRPIYLVTIRKTSLTPVLAYGTKTEEPYNGYVYCVTVPNHIIYVRRNGKPAWCGNCFVDNGAGSASSALLAACDVKLNGNINTDTPGYHPAGMPYGVSAVVPILANVLVSGQLGPLSNQSQLTTSISGAIQSYFTLPFNTPASQPVLAATVSNAALGQLSSLTVQLMYASASAVPVQTVSGAPYTRVILNSMTLLLAPFIS